MTTTFRKTWWKVRTLTKQDRQSIQQTLAWVKLMSIKKKAKTCQTASKAYKSNRQEKTQIMQNVSNNSRF